MERPITSFPSESSYLPYQGPSKGKSETNIDPCSGHLLLHYTGFSDRPFRAESLPLGLGQENEGDLGLHAIHCLNPYPVNVTRSPFRKNFLEKQETRTQILPQTMHCTSKAYVLPSFKNPARAIYSIQGNRTFNGVFKAQSTT